MKALIADDEKIIRRAIINTIHWKSFGISTVLEARNGKEALAIFRTERPEIIVTDIRMPLMDGIELIREVRKLSSEVQVIYITGFSDVEYLRSALKNAAADYILKPVNPQELLAALEKCTQKSRSLSQNRAYLESMEKHVRISTPLLTHQLLTHVLYATYPSKQTILDNLSFLKSPLDVDASYQTAVFSFHTGGRFSALGDDLLCMGIINITEELVREKTTGYLCHLGDLEFACILLLEDGAPAEIKFFEEIQNTLAQYLDASSFIVVGPVVEGFFNIQESFSYAYQGLQQQFRFSPNRTVPYTACKPSPSQPSYTVGEQALLSLSAWVYSGNLAEANRAWKKIFAEASKTFSSIREIHSLCILVCSHIFLNFGKRYLSAEGNSFFLSFISRLESARYTEDFQNLVEAFFQDFFTLFLSQKSTRKQQIVSEVSEYILKNLGASLTIKDISSHIFLAPTYLCAVFKEETGDTINAYITKQKMQYAAQLLSTGELRVYEVAKKLTYTDVKYFSNLFRRYFGVSPSEYKGKGGLP